MNCLRAKRKIILSVEELHATEGGVMRQQDSKFGTRLIFKAKSRFVFILSVIQNVCWCEINILQSGKIINASQLCAYTYLIKRSLTH